MRSTPEYMEGVKNLCGYNIKKLVDYGEEGLKQFYKEEYGIDWLAIEGACDNWDYNIGQHFAQTNAFLEKHLQEHKGKGRANIVVSCYAGYNRSASVAVAFLLSHFQDMSLEEILSVTCPRRPLMFSKERWKPNKVQSNFLKQLIEYEISLRSNDFMQPGDERLSFTGATQASDTSTRLFTATPRESSGGIESHWNYVCSQRPLGCDPEGWT